MDLLVQKDDLKQEHSRLRMLASNEELPSISIVIPTFNSEGTLLDCLASIAMQKYAKEKIEILIVDGGSTDRTLSISKDFRCKIVENPFVIHPKGRPLGIAKAKGDLTLCLDSDNVLDSDDWLIKMVEPFKDPEIFASEPLYYGARDNDSLLTKYISLIGGDDPIAVYLGFYDRFSILTNRWTDSPVKYDDLGSFYKVEFLDPQDVPPLGSNGFMARSNILRSVKYDPFLHVEVVRRIIHSFNLKFAKVKVGIIHVHSHSIGQFLQKKRRRVSRRLYKPESQHFESSVLSKERIQKVVIRFLLLRPLLDIIKGFTVKPSKIWLLHPMITFGTAFIYAYEWMLKTLRFSREPASYETV